MTLSIVARCSRSGQFGVAAATAMPAIGKLLTYAAPRVGAVATHALVNPYLGIDGLKWLRQHFAAEDVVTFLKRTDAHIEARQFAVVDAAGRAVAFTGEECPDWAGHREGDGYSVQGNRLAGVAVINATAEVMERDSGNDLAARMVDALAAGVAAGGDTDGEESATLYIMDTEEYPLWDVRVDLHDDPITELRRLCAAFRARLIPKILQMPTRKNPAGSSEEESV